MKVVVPALPTTLDWSTSDLTSWVNFPVMLATQRGLTQLSADHHVEPCLARSWVRSVSAEGHERYLFELRSDVTWSDGVKLTAEDFVLGFHRALQGNERGDLADLEGADALFATSAAGAGAEAVERALQHVGVRALGPSTLEVLLTRPHNYFLARLANVYVYFPVPSHDLRGLSADAARAYFDRPRDGKPRALGPFRVERWDRAGERLRLVLNPRSAFLPKLQPGERAVTAITFLRSEVGPALFARGRVDFLAVDNAIGLRGDLSSAHRQPLLSTYFLAFNTQRPPLDSVEARRALAMALDPRLLTDGLMPDIRRTSVLVPAELPGGVSADRMAGLPSFDLTESKRLLAKAFHPERTLRLIYHAGHSFIPEVAVAERIKFLLRRVGVLVELEAREDFSAELARVGRDGFRAPDLSLRRIGADYAHPNSFLTFFTPQGNHLTGWETLEHGQAIARYVAYLNAADAQPRPEDGAALYAKAQEILLGEQVVLVPLFHPDRYYRVQPRVAGLGISPFNFLSLSDARWSAR